MTVSHWFQCFNDGDKSLEFQSHHDRSSTYDEDMLRCELELHPDANTWDLEKVPKCHYSTINRHLQFMSYRRVLSRWTHHALTYHDRAVRVNIA